MKSIKYIILEVILIYLIICCLPHFAYGMYSQREDFSTQAVDQHVSFGFFETYTWTEVLSGLDPADRFFQLVETEGLDKDGCRLGNCQRSHSTELWAHIHSDSFRKQLPEDLRFAWGAAKDQQSMKLYALKQPAGTLKGPDPSQIQEVSVKKSEQGAYELFISFSEEGAKLWADLTGANVGRDIAIVFNDLVYAAPNVREAIKHGKCSISGNFDEKDVKQILSILEQ
jgi:SecD/SecF fusion protein